MNNISTICNLHHIINLSSKWQHNITNHGFSKGSKSLICCFSLMDMYILSKRLNCGLHDTYFLTNQLNCGDLFDWIHLVNMYNFNQNGQWSLSE
jgi:hypothetical protein